MKNLSRVRTIAMAAGLAAFSAVVQLVHIGYQSPQFGMWIDIVAVGWIIALFLFGFRISMMVSIIGALMITLFAPDTWLGASMKLVATLPTVIILSAWLLFKKKKNTFYSNKINLIIPLVISLIIRSALVLPINYYYAIPIWTGLSSAKAMQIIPWYVIVLFNIIQGIIEVVFAWLLVFKFRLSRYANWHK
ncbi:MAG: hypothetical protein US11_C0004G0020 [Candidatus Roizmanbacteria bacterium GW2011_GWA2_36_23]|uniref:Riboflavin transporter n=1 Tax=Candidatus Roizmanbacteria bacterium GW2011_GWA2_36_23 TaxID=1618480 RepID=A0A0G0EKX0_9BACT|nr:MAG: hypothetical protein US11_C0004G0020 [Candidatus Roizmanbacteria bacterium GW2011_GWA2_36_23]